MRLVTFRANGGTRVGMLDIASQTVIDLSAAAPGLPRDIRELIALGDAGLAKVKAAVAAKQGGTPLAQLQLLAPIPRPARNIFCVGKNYHEHAREFHGSGFDASAGKDAVPDVPIIFTKPPSCVIGPGMPIPAHLDPTQSVDYENELVVVIGKGGRGIPKARAFEHVYGYTIANDVTARTLQQRHRQWFIGKSIDGFCPMGPVLLTADEVPDVGKMHLVTRVNGELRQDAKVADLIFDIPTLIETISAGITLEPGDLIATGTPSGVGIGFKPPKYLKKGDVVSCAIEPIGELVNPVG
ncbi:MAG TPA: fumarylacetoacetate hydrolase family protein [Alphaproteobacteria bacterium]|nr:fumarylacetoacetate hydrolase family protein [Alphaproteobacteria bacterium]